MTEHQRADLLAALDELQHRLDAIADDLAALRARIGG